MCECITKLHKLWYEGVCVCFYDDDADGSAVMLMVMSLPSSANPVFHEPYEIYRAENYLA